MPASLRRSSIASRQRASTSSARDAIAAFPDGAIGRGRRRCSRCRDGRTATARAAATAHRNLVLFDLALDYSTCTRLALARADTLRDRPHSPPRSACCRRPASRCRASTTSRASSVMRTVAMLANEAADAVTQGVASPATSTSRCRRASTIRAGRSRWADDDRRRPRFATCCATSPRTMAKTATALSPLLARRRAVQRLSAAHDGRRP